MTLFLLVALNSVLIGYLLLPPLWRQVQNLLAGFQRAARYLRRPLTERRERALQRRTLMLITGLIGSSCLLALVALAYTPSLWLAHRQGHVSDALLSIPAIAGILAAGLVLGLIRVRQ